MDFRLRSDPSFQSGHRISVVLNGNEITEWALQEAWEHEYKNSERLGEARKAHSLEGNDVHAFAFPLSTQDDHGDDNEIINSSWGGTRCFLNRPPGMLRPLYSVNVEMVEKQYRYILEVWDGLGQWSFEPTKYPYFNRVMQIKQGRPGASPHAWCYYSHDFFTLRVVLTKSDIFNRFEKLTSYCNQDVQGVKDNCYCTFKIYLQSSLNTPHRGAKYVEFYVSGNAKLMTVFEALCGYKLRDTFTLTQFVQFGPEKGRGKTHSWFDSKRSRVEVKDLEWIIEDGAVWLLPMPYGITMARH